LIHYTYIALRAIYQKTANANIISFLFFILYGMSDTNFILEISLIIFSQIYVFNYFNYILFIGRKENRKRRKKIAILQDRRLLFKL